MANSNSPSSGDIGFHFQTKDFHTTIGNTVVHVQLVQLKKSCYLWIGDDQKTMDNLSVALPNPFDASPLITTILDRRIGDSVSARDEAQRIASKLAKKLGAQVFVTFGLAHLDTDMTSSVELFLFSLIKNGELFVL